MEHISENQGVPENLLQLRNRMQLTLADRFYGFNSNEKRIEWVEKYSSAFRTLAEQKPELLERFRTEPETVLKEAEEALYEKHSS